MRLYFELAKRSFRQQSAYRTANWAGFLTNSFFGCLRSYVFVSLFAARPTVVGYVLPDALAYVWLTQALLMYTYLWGWWEVSISIRTGQIAVDLSRPCDFYLYWLSRDAGRALYHLLFRGVPTYLAGVALFAIGVPTSPLTWLAFLVSLAAAELVSFSFRFLLNLTSFWLLDNRGVGLVAAFATSFFSGLLLPNAFFPEWLQRVSAWLPFQSILYVPSSVFLGKLAGADLAAAIGQQLLWFAGLALLGRALLALATRRLVLQGG